MNETAPMPIISVIIPVKDMAGPLSACLKAVKNQQGFIFGRDYEIIVVDDGSTDYSAQAAEAEHVTVVRQQNTGAAAARNAGAKLARGEILAFTDADCAPQHNWLLHIREAMADPATAGMKGVYHSDQKEPVARFVQLEYEYKYLRMDRQTTIDFIDTYSAAYRRIVFIENGGFDERFPGASVEDQEFSFRLAAKGYRMVFQRGAVVRHTHDRSLAEYLHRKYKIGYWKATLLRWQPEKTLTDSHTSPSQRWQILLLGATLALLPLLPFWKPAAALLFAGLLIFLASGAPFLAFIARQDPALLPAAAGLLFARAGALGVGLVMGAIAGRMGKRPGQHSLGMGKRAAKRLLDLLGGFAGLLFSLPVILLAALAIKLEDGGPVFFYQQRAGESGKPFRLIKLRSMRVNTDTELSELMSHSPLQGPVYKIPNDPRITRVGRFLRRWSLDELPQFWNVLVGEMSLVGPRPEELWVVNQYTYHQRLRLSMKPGLTGPMQIHGRGTLSFEERLDLELDYIDHYSVWNDLRILLQTFPVILNGYGAF